MTNDERNQIKKEIIENFKRLGLVCESSVDSDDKANVAIYDGSKN